jgi:hypothetical protein
VRRLSSWHNLTYTYLEGAVIMRARSPKHSFLCDSRVPFQELIYWRFRSNWQFRSISIARQPFRSPVRSISIYFDLFQSILIYFDLFGSISIYFDHFDQFRSLRSILIHFDLFRFILIPTSSGKRNYCHRSSGKWCILHCF